MYHLPHGLGQEVWILVTDNENEFRRVKSLSVENWRDRQD